MLNRRRLFALLTGVAIVPALPKVEEAVCLYRGIPIRVMEEIPYGTSPGMMALVNLEALQREIVKAYAIPKEWLIDGQKSEP